MDAETCPVTRDYSLDYLEWIITDSDVTVVGAWKTLSAEEVSEVETGTGTADQPATTDNTADTDTDPPQGGLANGAKAGMGIGVGLGALAVLGGLGFFFIRRRNRASKGDTEGSVAAVNSGNAPSHGWYQPVKTNDAISPGMQPPSDYGAGAQSTNGMFYPQQYQQQPYPQLEQQRPYYAQELTAVGNTPMELPGSNPQNYDPQLLGVHAAPQNCAQNPTPSSVRTKPRLTLATSRKPMGPTGRPVNPVVPTDPRVLPTPIMASLIPTYTFHISLVSCNLSRRRG
ncbi:hypothetical protein DL769_006338 [Monosporascus sp. CRB-8-3]|nr:hypothetical protein DL769_006338 [Monosporascus sp. CRB-8-3]